MEQDAEERGEEGGEDAAILSALLNVLRNMFPDNIVSAAVDMNILGVITFSLFFGICLVGLGDEAATLIQGINASHLSHSAPLLPHLALCSISLPCALADCVPCTLQSLPRPY